MGKHGIFARTMFVVRDHTAELHGQPVHWRSSLPEDGEPDGVPTLFVHGVPTSGADWTPFLERVPGIAPDLPGFGESGKRGDLDYTIEGYGRFLDAFVELAGLDRVNLLVHDWGAVGLPWARRNADRVERIVVMNAVPLGQDYRWHWAARLWRTPAVGELFIGSMVRWTAKPILSRAFVRGVPDGFVDGVFDHFDQGTQRAILHLYRSAPPDVVRAAFPDAGELEGPSLVVWGDRDPYIDVSHATAFAVALPDATLRTAAAGHWPWLDDPALVDEISDFLRGTRP